MMKRIWTSPNRQSGKPCIKGTRIPVEAVMSFVDKGSSIAEIIRQYPDLTRADVLAAIRYWNRKDNRDRRRRALQAELADARAFVRGTYRVLQQEVRKPHAGHAHDIVCLPCARAAEEFTDAVRRWRDLSWDERRA